MRAVRHSTPDKAKGFTLIELMVALAILGILFGVAAPAARDFIVSQRIKTASMDAVAGLMLARSEAIKQNGNVTVVPVSGSWTNGWTITGPDTSGPNGGVVSTQGAYSGLTITGPASIVFDRTGRVSGTTARLQISDSVNDGKYQPRCVSVGLTGHPKSTTGVCS